MIKKQVFGSAVICALISTAPAFSETLPAFSELVRDLYTEIEGKEVPITGAIGTQYGEKLYFYDETGSYPILLDAGRSVRRDLEGCEINPFQEPEQAPCQVSGMAEIKIDWDASSLPKGFSVELIVFEAEVTKR